MWKRRYFTVVRVGQLVVRSAERDAARLTCLATHIPTRKEGGGEGENSPGDSSFCPMSIPPVKYSFPVSFFCLYQEVVCWFEMNP